MNVLRLKTALAVSVVLLSLHGFIHLPAALADTRYVSDLMIISVKEGQDPDAPVIGYLRSAAAVEVLEETQELMHIRTEDGLQGWVRKKFLVKDKPKAVIIMELEQKIALLEENIRALQNGSDPEELINNMDAFKQEIATLKASLDNEKNTSSSLQKELNQVDAAYRQLLKKSGQTDGIQEELASLKNENAALKEAIARQPSGSPAPMLSGKMKWFLIGGGVLLLGFIMGRSLKGKRTYRY
jgi:SH3 domain protein